VALLGVLKAGAAFAILDPIAPPARNALCVAAAAPRAWLAVGDAPVAPEVERALEECCPGRGVRVPPEREAADAELGGGDASTPVGPESLAYVAFTSGTTGGVKGILGAHGPVAHFLDWHAATFGLGSDDRFAMLSGLAHDPLLRDVFTPLSLGATLVVPAPRDIEGPGSLAAWAARERISVMHLTPAMAYVLTEGVPEGSLPLLEHVFLGGDTLTAETISRLRAVAPHAECVNFYGATETPQAMGWHRVSDAPPSGGPGRGVSLPLGRGIRDVQLLVLGGGGLLAGIGELGEIAVRTPHLARGYVNDPERTGERFVASPFGSEPWDRLYLTGDLGRFDPDGAVEFCGRRDGQVKIRGYRVEMGEVESALALHSGVARGAVAVLEDGAGDRRLVGYLVASPGSTLSAAEVREHLGRTLPDYMIPSSLVFLEKLPLTPSGKVDRRALPAPDPAGEARPYEAPRTPTEQALALIWAELLKVDRVGVRDNFFALGGHSLLAMRVAARIQRDLRGNLPLRAFFETPTLEGIARAVDGAAAEPAAVPPQPAIPRVSRAARRVRDLETGDR